MPSGRPQSVQHRLAVALGSQPLVHLQEDLPPEHNRFALLVHLQFRDALADLPSGLWAVPVEHGLGGFDDLLLAPGHGVSEHLQKFGDQNAAPGRFDALTKIKTDSARRAIIGADRERNREMLTHRQHTNCTTCPRRALTEWHSLQETELGLLDRGKRDQILRPGDIIFNQGDACEGIYCLKEGLVGERRVDAEGHSTLVRLSHPGTVIGYQEFLSKRDHHNSAEVLQESYLCFIGKSVVQQLLMHGPKLGERFLRRSLDDAHKLEDALIEARTHGVRNRLLHLLMVFYERSGHHDPDRGHVFHIPVARQDLAELVGTAPETISRAIRRLEQDRVMHFRGNTATIPDLDVVFRHIA